MEGPIFPGGQGGRGKGKERIGDDSDESQPTKPTPTAKIAQALHSVQGTTTLDVDRSWAAFESDDALKILSKIYDSENYIDNHIWKACDKGKSETVKAISLLITLRLEQMERELGKGVETKIAQG